MSDLSYDPQRDWFYRGREVGERKERERIIKLLDEQELNISDCCFQPDCCLKTDDIIALIKGEK